MAIKMPQDEEFGGTRRRIVDMAKRMPHRRDRLPLLSTAEQYMVLQLSADGSGKLYPDWDWLRFHS